MRLGAIDGLRAIAVLAVVTSHLSPNPTHPLELGGRGVDLFFVISGLCLSLPTLSQLHAGQTFTFNVRRFAIARFWRIAPPYWLAIALFGTLSLTAFGVPSVHGPIRAAELGQDASIFFTGPAPAYNPSFWTLGLEARWYIFFPALLFMYVRSKVAFGLTGLLFYVWYSTKWSIPDIGTLPCFMLGIVAADLSIRGHARHFFWLPLSIAGLALACALDRGQDHGSPLWHLAAFSIVLAGLGVGSRAIAWRPLAFFGVSSYSIYLLHGPFMTWFLRSGAPAPIALAFGVGVGVLFWAAVEKPTLALRERLLVQRSKPRPIAHTTQSV